MRTRRSLASALIVGLAIASLAGCTAGPATDSTTDSAAAGSSSSAVAGDSSRLAPEVDAALDALVDAGATAAVIDVRDADGRASGAAGVRGPDDSAPAQPTDRLRIASVTKTMTATVIMQLIDEGVLTLDTVVDDVVPGLLDSPAPVSVGQLLAHTSGAPDYFSVIAPDTDAYIATTDVEYSAEALVDAAQTQPWVNAPGEAFSYANTNYVVLGRIAETLTGDPLPELLRTRIIEPLGMHDTEYPDASALPAGALRGVIDDDGTSIDTGDASASLWNAGAAVISTVGDVSTFFQALFAGELVSAESVAAMQQIGVEGYGLGVLAGGDACGANPAELVFGQRGNGVGYRVMAFGSPDGQRFVTVGWTGGTFDPATDPLVAAGNDALVAGLVSTCP